MTRRSRIAAIVLALALVPATALAEGKGSKKKGDDTVAVGVPSHAYKEACTDGNTKYAARDFPAAIEAYRKAIEHDPKNPLGFYLLGEAQLAGGNLTEAEASWNRASLEASEKEPALRAKILFVLADLKERQKKWEEARAAWQVYLDWASKYSNAGAFPGSAQSRQQVIDTVMKLDKAYAVVRQRIADTKGGGVFTDMNKPAPPR